jgi:hypothetical protein
VDQIYGAKRRTDAENLFDAPQEAIELNFDRVVTSKCFEIVAFYGRRYHAHTHPTMIIISDTKH